MNREDINNIIKGNPTYSINDGNDACYKILKKENEDKLIKKATPRSKVYGLRIPCFIHYLLKPQSGANYDYPIKDILNSALIYFMKLSNEQKIEFLYDNSLENTKLSEIKSVIKGFDNYIDDYLLEHYYSPAIISKLKPEEKLEAAIHILKRGTK